MERVEATFIKHFSNSNRTKAINILRPKAKRDKHRITFSMGKIDLYSISNIYIYIVCFELHGKFGYPLILSLESGH
jgi:hypothetical protein